MDFRLFKLLMAPEGESGGGGTGEPGSTGEPGGTNEPAPEGIRIGENGPVAKLPDGVTDTVKNAVNGPLKNFFDNDGNVQISNVLESYVNVQKVMGQDKVLKPREDWGDEQWKEFNRNIGVPENVADYKIANNVPEGMKANDEMFGALVASAHEAGILPQQFQVVADKFNALTKEFTDAQVANNQTAFQADVDKLKGEWGDGYEAKVKQADAAMAKFATEAELAELKNLGLDKDPVIQRLFAKVADGLLEEDNPVFTNDNTQTFGATPEKAKEMIALHMQKPEKDTKHPQHAVWTKQYMELLEAAHGKAPANQSVNPGGNVARMR